MGLGCGVWKLGFRVQGSGFRVWGSGFRVQVLEVGPGVEEDGVSALCKVGPGSGFRVYDL